MNRIRMCLLVLVLQFVFLACFSSGFSLENPPFSEEDTTSGLELGCHRQLYTYRVNQIDSEGRECWDDVSAFSCRGRCPSSEVSGWKFPFILSDHLVCIHAARSKSVTMLRHCHPDVDPETRQYEYLEAVACHCQTCSENNTDCRYPRKDKDEETELKELAMSGGNFNGLGY